MVHVPNGEWPNLAGTAEVQRHHPLVAGVVSWVEPEPSSRRTPPLTGLCWDSHRSIPWMSHRCSSTAAPSCLGAPPPARQRSMAAMSRASAPWLGSTSQRSTPRAATRLNPPTCRADCRALPTTRTQKELLLHLESPAAQPLQRSTVCELNPAVGVRPIMPDRPVQPDALGT